MEEMQEEMVGPNSEEAPMRGDESDNIEDEIDEIFRSYVRDIQSPQMGERRDGGQAGQVEFDNSFNVEDFTTVSSSEDEEESAKASAGFNRMIEPAAFESALFRGRTFENWDQYDAALDEYEALSGMRFNRKKKNPEVARARCRGHEKGDPDSCRVEICTRRMKRTGQIMVRKVFLQHTCPLKIHQFRNGSHKSKWVARKIINHVKINPNMSMNHLSESLRNFHAASSKPWSVQRARAMCREELTGGSKETFQKIPAYIAAIRCADPNGHAYFQTGEERRFARLYISPGACRNVYSFCRPLVGLDGTHTAGKYPMVLLLATCFDGENHIVILAWAVVKVENGDNWSWFLEHLRATFPKMREANTVFITDRDKGLKSAVAESFPGAHHAHCVQHIRANIKGHMDVQCNKYFKKVALPRTEEEYEALLTSFKPTTERQAKFVPYVRNMNPAVYARHAFPAPRYGHNTSNVVEIINGAVRPSRVFPALLLSDYLWNYVMEHFCKRAEHAKLLPDGAHALTQYASNMGTKLYRESRTVRERRSSESVSLMVDPRGSWVVDISQRTCACKEWEEMEFPCIHAFCSLLERGLEVRQYVGDVWLASTLRKAYDKPVPPLSIDRLSISKDNCFEPTFPEKSQFKKTARRNPSWGEQMARTNERLVRKQSHKCGLCKQPGHNKRCCPSFPPGSDGPTAGSGGPTTSSQVQCSHVPDSQADGSHSTVVVGSIHSATRETELDMWELYQTRSSTLTFVDWLSQGGGT